MDIFDWGRPLRQVQTCESRDVHILGNYITVIVLLLLLKKRKINIICFHLRLIEQERCLAEGFGIFYQIWSVGGSRMESFLSIDCYWIFKVLLSVALSFLLQLLSLFCHHCYHFGYRCYHCYQCFVIIVITFGIIFLAPSNKYSTISIINQLEVGIAGGNISSLWI